MRGNLKTIFPILPFWKQRNTWVNIELTGAKFLFILNKVTEMKTQAYLEAEEALPTPHLPQQYRLSVHEPELSCVPLVKPLLQRV